MKPYRIFDPQVPRPLPEAGRTYVPWALMKPAWSGEHPQRVDNWDVERDVMTWLKMHSIEETMALYQKRLSDKPSDEDQGFWKYLTGLFMGFQYGRCHHRVNTWLKRCPVCDSWSHEAIKHLEELKKRVVSYYASQAFWLSLDGPAFERYVANLFTQHGWDVTLTGTSGDGGIDLFIRKDGKLTGVQCKAHKSPVGPSVVRDLYGAMKHFGADNALLICVGGFTRGVLEFAEAKPITLMTLEELLAMSLMRDP